jgi:hypothetical protein
MRALLVLLVAALLALAAVAWLQTGNDGSNGKPAAVNGAFGSPMGPLEEATNRQGRDISQAAPRTDDASQCSLLCSLNPDCRAMSFAKDGDGKGGICLLKSDVPTATQNAAVISAVKIASAPKGGG